ncbi:Threonine aspartase [Balamuthia mandrillaris]
MMADEEDARRRCRRPFFVAVHAGAGYHAPKNERRYLGAMKRALLMAASASASVSVEEGEEVALAMVVSAVSSLEDDPCSNAGFDQAPT